MTGKQPKNTSANTLETAPAVRGMPPLSLPASKQAAREDIDRIAGIMRGEMLSQGYGQEMTYLAKEAEARAFMAAVNPVAADYPLLSREVGITADTLTAVATLVAEKAEAWRLLAGQIEAVRLGAKRAINAAANPAEINTIMAGLAWPTSANGDNRETGHA